MYKVGFDWNQKVVKVLKGVRTYYVCQVRETGNGCIEEETFLPRILPSSFTMLLSLLFTSLKCVVC